MFNDMLQDNDMEEYLNQKFLDKEFHEFIEEDKRRCLVGCKEEVLRVWDLDCLADSEESCRIMMEEHGMIRYLAKNVGGI